LGRRAVVEDVSADLDRINGPVLVLAGAHDRVEPVELMPNHVIAEIDGAQLDVIPGSGHLIPLERTQELSDHIPGFRDTIIGS
jgi:pimeloyl-ACP methyl ester carboxylesterase